MLHTLIQQWFKRGSLPQYTAKYVLKYGGNIGIVTNTRNLRPVYLGDYKFKYCCINHNMMDIIHHNDLISLSIKFYKTNVVINSFRNPENYDGEELQYMIEL